MNQIIDQEASRAVNGERRPDYGSYADSFETDGVVHIPQAFSPADMEIVEAAYNWKLANPGPRSQQLYPESGAKFLVAGGYSVAQPAFERLLKDTAVGDLVAALFRSGPVWFIGEQLFYKEGGGPASQTRRTPWHQDSSYLPFIGKKIAVVWINLDPVPLENALEVVRKSHTGVTYNGSMFDPEDDTAPLYLDSPMPRLPDIEAERDKWDIVARAAEPGDALVFHTAALHGGGGTRPGARRRSLTLRFVGDDVVRIERPNVRLDSAVVNPEHLSAKVQQDDEAWKLTERYEALAPGEPLHHASLAMVRPGQSVR